MVRKSPSLCASAIAVFGIGQDVGDVDGAPSSSARPVTDPGRRLRWDVPRRSRHEFGRIAVASPHDRRCRPSCRERSRLVRARKAAPPIRRSVSQHCLQIEGRAADDLQHVGRRGLLLQRLAQLARAACTSSNSRRSRWRSPPGRRRSGRARSAFGERPDFRADHAETPISSSSRTSGHAK